MTTQPTSAIVVVIDGLEVKLPSKFEVCPTCEGKGTHVNPAIDGQGLTVEDFDEQGPEFKADYFAGVYDVACHECNGLRVVMVVDRERCNPRELAAYQIQQQELAQMYAIEAAERRMGA